jgi:6-phosphogluconate dehydrogenase
MQIGIAGLGRMGANIARRLVRNGHDVVVYNRTADKVTQLEQEGATGSRSLQDLVGKLKAPRAVWVMMPAGEVTAATIQELASSVDKGDIIIDGGNTRYTDDARHAAMLKTQGVHFVDCGTSGGIWGLERGYCLMIGGESTIVQHLDPIFRTLAPGSGDIPKTPPTLASQSGCGIGVSALRAGGRRTLRQDGAQRY